MITICEPSKNIEIVEQTDVCVVGGSCTGVFAAVRAARLGAKVCIIEKGNCFGGVATNGFVNGWTSFKDSDNEEQIVAGLSLEVLEEMKKRDAIFENAPDDICAYRMNTEDLKLTLDKLVLAEGISVYLHTMYCNVITMQDQIEAIIIENKDGRKAIEAKFVIDATGDGDIARDLELKMFRNHNVQPPSACFKFFGDFENLNISQLIDAHKDEFDLPEDWGWNGMIPGMPQLRFMAQTHVFDLDCSKAAELTCAELEGRRKIKAVIDIFKKYSPNNATFSPAAICPQIGIRDTVHYETNYKLIGEELISGKKHKDAIGYGTYPIDIHNADCPGITFKYLNGKEVFEPDYVTAPIVRKWHDKIDYPRYYDIPFKVLVQDKYKNYIPVGRMINADESAFGAIRVMVNLNQLAEAAGVAAYLSIQNNQSISEIDTQMLRKMLKYGGSIIL